LTTKEDVVMNNGLAGSVRGPGMAPGSGATMVSLHALKAAAWRSRRLWLTTALVGMVIGAAFHLVVPRKFAAEASLYLVQPQGSDPPQAMANDASMIKTRSVATMALRSLGVGINPDTFVSSYRVSVVSDAILSITLTASSPSDAVTRANAVARSFLSFRASQFRQQTQVARQGLQSEATALEGDISSLNNEINALTATAESSPSQISQLQAEKSSDATQLTNIEAQIQQDRLDVATVTTGSRLLDPAAVVPVSGKKVVAADALTGLVGGLGLGLLAVVVRTILSDRPRRRQDVATALGVPVELSLGHYSAPWWSRRLRLPERAQHPGPGSQLAARRLRAHLDASPSSTLAVVAIEAEEPAALAVAYLARSLAAHRRVVVADLLDGHPLATIFRVREDEVGRHVVLSGGSGEIALVVGSDDPTDPPPNVSSEGADVTIVAATVDPALGADELSDWATEAVMIVGAGRASAAQLHTTSQLLRNAGIVPSAAVLIGADEDDDSLGTVVQRRTAGRGVEARSPGVVRAGQW
jgi:capsular polysaccharide biosynthesis protein